MVSFRDDPSSANWRTEVQRFLSEHLPNGWQRGMDERAWLEKLRAQGWYVPAWPQEYGGQDMSVQDQFVMNQEFALKQAPRPRAGVGISLAGPTIISWGTAEQKAQFIPELLKPGAFWCQLYSEPGAGSDLASLQTRAERDGDHWRVNGQKIWTTYGHRAQYGILLARTDPTAPKHKGISYFIVDMKSPGITVRPLVNMGNEHHFNEVFFEDALIPNENIIGGLNNGWYVGASTLNFERSNIGSAIEVRQRVEAIIDSARVLGVLGDPIVRHQLADVLIATQVASLLSYRVISMQVRGIPPAYESGLSKLFTTELLQRIAQLGMRVLGMPAQVMAGNYSPGIHALRYLLTVQTTIAGGTSEIQRSMIAAKGLGLPRD